MTIGDLPIPDAINDGTITLSAPVAIEWNRQASVPNRRAGVHYGADLSDFFIQAAYIRRS